MMRRKQFVSIDTLPKVPIAVEFQCAALAPAPAPAPARRGRSTDGCARNTTTIGCLITLVVSSSELIYTVP